MRGVALIVAGLVSMAACTNAGMKAEGPVSTSLSPSHDGGTAPTSPFTSGGTDVRLIDASEELLAGYQEAAALLGS